jgi:NAD+ synthase
MSLKTDIVNWIKDYVRDDFNLVVGISGGIDSSVVSTLCAETGIKTYVATLPIQQNKLLKGEDVQLFYEDLIRIFKDRLDE